MIDAEARIDPKKFYNARFEAGYMHGFDYDIYEICRLYTVRKMLRTLSISGFEPSSILDYGCGEGRYIGELRNWFQSAKVQGCDISDVGLQIAKSNYPGISFTSMQNESVQFHDDSFDLVLSIEVLEHVQDAPKAVREIVRVLKPSGMAIITTPCANRFSLEWFLNWRSGGLQPSPDGYGRFASDEPAHLRRLTSRAVSGLFESAGAKVDAIYHRSHFFTPIAHLRVCVRLLPLRFRAMIALLDWHLFRRLPNGATMILLCRKN
jgi:SAM-dependent methyltransferase